MLIVRCLFCGADSGNFVFLLPKEDCEDPFSLLGELEEDETVIIDDGMFCTSLTLFFSMISIYSPLDLFCYSACFIL